VGARLPDGLARPGGGLRVAGRPDGAGRARRVPVQHLYAVHLHPADVADLNTVVPKLDMSLERVCGLQNCQIVHTREGQWALQMRQESYASHCLCQQVYNPVCTAAQLIMLQQLLTATLSDPLIVMHPASTHQGGALAGGGQHVHEAVAGGERLDAERRAVAELQLREVQRRAGVLQQHRVGGCCSQRPCVLIATPSPASRAAPTRMKTFRKLR
jgi:hypothetical protein